MTDSMPPSRSKSGASSSPPDGDAVTAEPELRAFVDPAVWDDDVEESTESLDVVALDAEVPLEHDHTVGAVEGHAAIVQVVLTVLGDEEALLFEREGGMESVIFASVPG